MVIFNYLMHLLIGVLIGLHIAHSSSDMVFVLLGSLLPDIDTKKSTLGRFNPFSRFMTHRGKTHTILGSALLSAPFLLINTNAFIMVYVGCLSHIFGDKLQSLFRKRKFKLKLW